ncbi:MAG: HEAT repeat domain-containing protein, partial [Candidatus Anstonellales archaeon]
MTDDRRIQERIKKLKDNDPNVRYRAAEALREIGFDKIPIESKVLALLILGEIDEVVAIGKPAVPALMDALKYWDVQKRAAGALVRIGKPAVPALINALKNVELYMREKAAEALGEIGDARAVPALIDALKDWEQNVRENAAKAIGKIAEKGGDCSAAVPALIDALKDKNEDVREGAAEALGEIGDARAVPALIDALKDEKWYVRGGAAIALGKIGVNEEQLKEITRMLEEGKTWEERNGAAIALGKIGDARAVPALIDALKDKNENVRENAAEALGEIAEKGGDCSAA